MTASSSARADDAADAQADVIVDSPLDDAAFEPDADDAADDMQYAGCSAAPYQSGGGQTGPVSLPGVLLEAVHRVHQRSS